MACECCKVESSMFCKRVDWVCRMREVSSLYEIVVCLFHHADVEC